MFDVTELQVADHPVRWRDAVMPADVAGRGLYLAPGGAVAAASRADALVALDARELQRRTAVGLGAVGALHLLDSLLSLPLGCPIAMDDLTQREQQTLRAAPHGCVEIETESVTRMLQVPATVVAVVVRGSRWRNSLRRVAAFAPFAQRIVVLPATPSVTVLLEAQVTGVGIWIDRGTDGFEVAVPPEPFVPRYFKAAGWRFAENAYRAATDFSDATGHVISGRPRD